MRKMKRADLFPNIFDLLSTNLQLDDVYDSIQLVLVINLVNYNNHLHYIALNVY